MRITAVTSGKTPELLLKKVTFAFSDDPADTLEAWLRMPKLNAATFARIQERAADASDAATVLAPAIVELVDRWNLTDEDGAPIALTVEALTALGDEVVSTLFGAIVHASTEAASGKGSSKRSKPRTR